MKYIHQKEYNYSLIFLISLLYLITLYPMTSIGFTSDDDIYNYITSIEGNWFNHAWQISTGGTGRFQLMIIRPFYLLAYLIDNPIYYYGLMLVPLILCIIVFAKCINILTKNKAIAIFIFAMFPISFQLFGAYCIPVSYPFFFPFSFLVILLSHLFLIKYYTSEKKYNLYISVALYSFGILFYETYLLYIVSLAAIILHYNKPLKTNIKKCIIDTLPFITVNIIFFVIFFYFRSIYPSEYYGSEFAENFSINRFFASIFNYTKGSFPFIIYFNIIEQLKIISLWESGFKNNLIYILSNANITCYIKGLLSSMIIWNIMQMQIPNPRKIWKWLIIGFLLAFIPPFSIAVTGKYQEILLRGYLPTFFSYFGTITFLSAILLIIYKLSSKIKILKYFVTAIILITIFLTGFFSQLTNEQVAIDLNKIKVKDHVTKQLYQMDFYKQIEDGAVLYFNTQNNRTSTLANLNPQYMEVVRIHLNSKIYSNKNLNIYTNYDKFYNAQYDSINKNTVYIFNLKQTAKTNEILISFSKVEKCNLQKDFTNIQVDSLTVLYYSPTKKFSIGYMTTEATNKCTQHNFNIKTTENTHDLSKCYKIVHIENNNLNEIFSRVKIKSNNINFASVIASNFE